MLKLRGMKKTKGGGTVKNVAQVSYKWIACARSSEHGAIKQKELVLRRPPTTIQLTPQAIPIENAQWPPAVFTSASLPLNTMIATADSLVTHVPYTQSGLRCTELEQWNAEQLQFIHMRSSSANPLCWRYQTHWMRIRKPIPMVFFLQKSVIFSVSFALLRRKASRRIFIEY